MEKQIISPPIKLLNLAEIFICKQRNNKIFTWYGCRNDTFCANRLLTGVTITFILCLYRVTGVSIGQVMISHVKIQLKISSNSVEEVDFVTFAFFSDGGHLGYWT